LPPALSRAISTDAAVKPRCCSLPAAALTAAGYPISAKTLSGKATRGGGPPYGLFAGRALYRWGAALVWARSHVTAPPSADASAGETGV
jgi:hypothetical protein